MTRPLQTFRGDARGNVAILVAVSLMVLVTIVLGTLNIAQAYVARYHLQAALDSAALAAANETINRSASVATIQSQLAAVAQKVLAANLSLNPGLATVAPVQVKYTPPVGFTVPDKIELSASATVNTSFLGSLGIKPMKVVVTSATEPPQNAPVELVLVLDVTASMNLSPSTGGEKKIDTLKAAAKALVDQVMGSNSPNIRVSVVPYTSYVNVGKRTPAPDWVFPFKRVLKDQCNVRKVWENPNAQCPDSYSEDCTVDGIFRPKGCTVTPACPARGKQICPTGELVDLVFTWDGCIGARSVLADPYEGAQQFTDQFLQTIASPTNPKYSGQPSFNAAPGTNCPKAEILDLTTDRTLIKARIDSLAATGDTYIPAGLIWGWNVLSPGVPYDNTKSKAELDLIGGKKVIVLMTDGVNSQAPRLYDGASLPFASLAYSYFKILGRTANKATVDWMTGNICNNIKTDGNGIQIYTVMFDVQEEATQNILRNCTNDPATMAFTASDRDGLLKAFKDIGDQLRLLKLTN